jgi:hypothetical protein
MVNELDNKGKIVNRFHDGELLETYKYDLDGNVSYVIHPQVGTDVYMYDGNGLAVKQLSLSEENPLFSSLLSSVFGNGPKKKLTIFINDDWGNIVEMKVYNAETKELLFTQKNVINQQGDEIESIGYNGDGTIYSHVKYLYSYDTMGNWVLKRNLSKEGDIYMEEERDIIYYN